MEKIEITYRTEQLTNKTFILPYFCKHKIINEYFKVISSEKTIRYTDESVGIYNTVFFRLDELIEISEAEYEEFATKTKNLILNILNNKI